MNWFLSFLFTMSSVAFADCIIRDSNGGKTVPKDDPLYKTLTAASECPRDVRELKKLLLNVNAKIAPAMVANRGRHNPGIGSFSFFESVTGIADKGEFFFGHFTSAEKQQLVLDQEPQAGKLLIELIVWDKSKEVYNFYELVGTRNSSQWFYRGDSLDALKDNQFVYRDVPQGQEKFGKTMRCSACHSSGGPIMKELVYPHNDWWTAARPLGFGVNKPSTEVNDLLQSVISAEVFAEEVKIGIQKLEASSKYQNFRSSLSLQEVLRPLFCENEINIESDVTPNSIRMTDVKVPSGFLINPSLTQAQLGLKRTDYERLSRQAGLIFPETTEADADHAWLTPVKGFSDLLAIQTLIAKNIIDEEFMWDVLALDFHNPLFSQARCQLLKLVPTKLTADWKNKFIRSLDESGNKVALELSHNITVSSRDKDFHRQQVESYVRQASSMTDFFAKLLAIRKEAFNSEISQNPRGQILEPGFRVIFPEATN